MRAYGICLFINLLVCLVVKGQIVMQTISLNNSGKQGINMPVNFNQNIKKDTSVRPFIYRFPVSGIPPGYYNKTIGFFCIKELQVQKALKIPLKFRLGSVAYTDKMEGKGAGYYPTN